MTEPRWLNDDEQKAWRAFLEATSLVITGIDHQLQRDADLSHADYEILVRLSEAPERRMRMSALAEVTLFSRSRLSHACSRLERDGLVRREGTPEDKRGTIAVLTDKGFATLEESAPGHVEEVRRLLLDPLTPEQVCQLGAIAATVRDAAARR